MERGSKGCSHIPSQPSCPFFTALVTGALPFPVVLLRGAIPCPCSKPASAWGCPCAVLLFWQWNTQAGGGEGGNTRAERSFPSPGSTTGWAVGGLMETGWCGSFHSMQPWCHPTFTLFSLLCVYQAIWVESLEIKAGERKPLFFISGIWCQAKLNQRNWEQLTNNPSFVRGGDLKTTN